MTKKEWRIPINKERMEETTTKEQILKRVRDALISKRENPFKNIDFNSSVFQRLSDEKEVVFASKLIEMSGTFVYCENEKALADKLAVLREQKKWTNYFVVDEKIKLFLQSAEIPYESSPEKFTGLKAGITRCEYLIARFGSVLVSSGLDSGRRLFVFPESHIVIAYASQVVEELDDALKGMIKKYKEDFPSQMTVITGPSRTADIEKTLVMGAHGPRELYVFMVDDSE